MNDRQRVVRTSIIDDKANSYTCLLSGKPLTSSIIFLFLNFKKDIFLLFSELDLIIKCFCLTARIRQTGVLIISRLAGPIDRHRMLSNRLFPLYLMISFVAVGHGESNKCLPKKVILLSNCSLRSSSFFSPAAITTNEDRTLSMLVPYSLNRTEEGNLLIHQTPSKALIRLNLNMIQCSNRNLFFNWTSLESSSTLRGEFVRTTFIEKNIMYLPTGRTYLKHLATLDCRTQTLYRTDPKQIFQLDLRIESTLEDHCSTDQPCYPLENYQCDLKHQRCTCREPLQTYFIQDHYPICIQAVQTLDQCPSNTSRCVEWCHTNSSATLCLCPKDLGVKKFTVDQQAYCESRSGGICHSYLQCPLDEFCLDGSCQNVHKRSYQSISLDMMTISIIISCLVLLLLSVILAIGIYILRSHRGWKKHYHSPQERTVPTMSDYDNITYGVFRKNVQLSSSDDTDMTTSDVCCSYEPKVVYLGGEQQLTAIYA